VLFIIAKNALNYTGWSFGRGKNDNFALVFVGKARNALGNHQAQSLLLNYNN